ncbi:hypothetical protein AFLA_004336 [Aspergillus flavus NRRL3357]|nr:hypothetical protein AFLA_004336 [Aspergillus flavus NRRL3357]
MKDRLGKIPVELHLVLVHYLAVVEFLSSSQERQSCFTQPVVHHPSRAPNISSPYLGAVAVPRLVQNRRMQFDLIVNHVTDKTDAPEINQYIKYLKILGRTDLYCNQILNPTTSLDTHKLNQFSINPEV